MILHVYREDRQSETENLALMSFIDHRFIVKRVVQQWSEESLPAEAAAAVQVWDAGERSRMLYLAERPRGRPGQLHRRGRQL